MPPDSLLFSSAGPVSGVSPAPARARFGNLIHFSDLRLPYGYARVRRVLVEYAEPDGRHATYDVELTCAGQGHGGRGYLGGFDAGHFRVFRTDRIHRILVLPTA